jgi:hypothetical protein
VDNRDLMTTRAGFDRCWSPPGFRASTAADQQLCVRFRSNCRSLRGAHLDFVHGLTTCQASGPIAVARLTQGISPKHCASARQPGGDCWRLSNSRKSPAPAGRHSVPGIGNRPTSCHAQPSVVSLSMEMRYVLHFRDFPLDDHCRPARFAISASIFARKVRAQN